MKMCVEKKKKEKLFRSITRRRAEEGGVEINRTPELVFQNRNAWFMQTIFPYEEQIAMLNAKFLCLVFE